VWRLSDNVLRQINEVFLRRARLLLRWVTVAGIPYWYATHANSATSAGREMSTGQEAMFCSREANRSSGVALHMRYSLCGRSISTHTGSIDMTKHPICNFVSIMALFAFTFFHQTSFFRAKVGLIINTARDGTARPDFPHSNPTPISNTNNNIFTVQVSYNFIIGSGLVYHLIDCCQYKG